MIRSIGLAVILAALLLPLTAVAQDLGSLDRLAPRVPRSEAPADGDRPWMEKSDVMLGAEAPVAELGPLGMTAPDRAHAPCAPRAGFPAVVSFLDLSDEQAESLRGLLGRRHEAVSPLRQEIHELERELHRLVQDGADAARIGENVLAIHALRERVRAIFVRSQRAFADLLDTDQLARYGAVRRSAALQPAVRAFRSLRLIAPPGRPADAP